MKSKKKMLGVLFKVDFENASNNMNWDLCNSMMVKKVFHIKRMILSLVK
jgi:hypothetical protein